MPPKKSAKVPSAPKPKVDEAPPAKANATVTKPPSKKNPVEPDTKKPTAYATKISRATKQSSVSDEPVANPTVKRMARKTTKDDPKPKEASKAAAKPGPEVKEVSLEDALEEMKRNNIVMIDKLLKAVKSLSKQADIADNKKTSKDIKFVLETLDELKLCNKASKKAKVTKAKADANKDDVKDSKEAVREHVKGIIVEAVKPVPKLKVEKSPRQASHDEIKKPREKSPDSEGKPGVTKNLPVEKVLPTVGKDIKSDESLSDEDLSEEFGDESWSDEDHSGDQSFHVGA